MAGSALCSACCRRVALADGLLLCGVWSCCCSHPSTLVQLQCCFLLIVHKACSLVLEAWQAYMLCPGSSMAICSTTALRVCSLSQALRAAGHAVRTAHLWLARSYQQHCGMLGYSSTVVLLYWMSGYSSTVGLLYWAAQYSHIYAARILPHCMWYCVAEHDVGMGTPRGFACKLWFGKCQLQGCGGATCARLAACTNALSASGDSASRPKL